MNMTISMFDSYFMRIQVARTNRIIDIAQATIYAQLTNEGRRETWNGWTRTITHINHIMNIAVGAVGARSVITWNGEPVDFKFLRAKFMSMFGRRAVA